MASHNAHALEKLRVPLTKLTAESTARLKGVNSSFTVKLPVPARWNISKATVHFAYVNSLALMPERSKLSVLLNKHVLGQVTLQPRSPEGSVDVKIPPGLLLNKYNDLEFAVSQNYTEHCSDPSAPELWTNIEFNESYIEIEYELKPVPARLSAIADLLFDPMMFGPNSVNLVLKEYSPKYMHLASLASSGVALRFQYRPVKFTVSQKLVKGSDNIVIGNEAFFTGLFDKKDRFTPSAPLAISQMPGDKGRAIIYVGGSSHEEMLKNARAFSALSYPLPDASFADVNSVELPEISLYQGRNMVDPDRTYSFKELGLYTRTFSGMDPATAEMTFRIPSDALIKENDSVILSLHLVYGASMRQDSVLNLALNGKFAGAIPFNDENGGRYQGYRIEIPGSLLSPGHNRLSFSPVLTPLKTGECLFIQTNNLAITLYEDSEISIPSMRHWIEMPSLSAVTQDGFPFTKSPDWKDTTVLLADKSAETAALAMNFIAMISQKSGVQPLGISFSYDMPEGSENDIVVAGPHGAIPEKVLNASPVGPVLQNPWAGHSKTGVEEDSEQSDSTKRNARIASKVIIGEDRFAVTEFESPFKLGKSVLMLTAKRAEDLMKGASALWEPALQSKLVNDLVIVDLNSRHYKSYSQEASKKYYVGKIGHIKTLDYFLHKYFWGTIAVLLVSIVLLAWIIYALLKKFMQKRLGNE